MCVCVSVCVCTLCLQMYMSNASHAVVVADGDASGILKRFETAMRGEVPEGKQGQKKLIIAEIEGICLCGHAGAMYARLYLTVSICTHV